MKNYSFPVFISFLALTVLTGCIYNSSQTSVNSGVHKICWTISNNGSFSVTSDKLCIKNCYPAIDGQSVSPEKVTVIRNTHGGIICYKLGNHISLTIDLTLDSNSLVLKSKFSGLSKAPEYFCPLAQGLVTGADRFYKQGLGFAGPSGVFPIPASPRRIDKPGLFDEVFSYDSYIESGIMDSCNNTLVFGAYDHKDYLQRTTIYNRQNRIGLVDRWEAMNKIFYEAGFSTENIPVITREFVLPDLHFIIGNNPYNTFRKFAGNIACCNKINLNKKPAYHWCSWYESERDFNEKILDDFLSGWKNIKPAIPIQTAQIDDGFCEYYGDWLKFDSVKFPSGFENDIKKITDAGLKAGIWTGPFMIHEKSDLYKKHPDWVLKNLDNSPVVEWNRTDGKVMALDASNPEAFEYLRHVFRTFKKMGITYFKTDFLDWGLKYSPKFKRCIPGKTSVQYYYNVLKMIREEIGTESFWLVCIAPFPPIIGLADAARNSNDISGTWSSGSQGNMLQESFSTQYLNNILWQNDPDVCYFRSFPIQMTDSEIKTLAYLDGITGGIVNTSDRFHRMPENYLKLWRFIQPAPERYTAKIPNWNKPGKLKVILRDLSATSWAVLILNPDETTRKENFILQNIIGKEKAFVFSWEPYGLVFFLRRHPPLPFQTVLFPRPHNWAGGSTWAIF